MAVIFCWNLHLNSKSICYGINIHVIEVWYIQCNVNPSKYVYFFKLLQTLVEQRVYKINKVCSKQLTLFYCIFQLLMYFPWTIADPQWTSIF